MGIDTVRTVLGIDDKDGHGSVTAAIERKFETIVRREIPFDPGAKVVVVRDHLTSIADQVATVRIGSFTPCNNRLCGAILA
jgi:hypothetical protein